MWNVHDGNMPAGSPSACLSCWQGKAAWGHRVVVLEDSDVLHLRHGAWGIFNAKHAENTAVSRALETLDMEVANIMKGGCARPPPRILHCPSAHD